MADANGLGDRLRVAIRQSGYSHHGFARAMEARGVYGSHYRTLVNYLKGRTEPSLEWLDEAADLLGVGAQWLAHGDDVVDKIPAHARTLRDEFAKAALRAIEIAAPPDADPMEFAPVAARYAYAIADAMLAERARSRRST